MSIRFLFARIIGFSVGSFFSVSIWAADPYKIIIFSDSASRGRAKDAMELIKKVPPFSQMGKQLVMEIKEIDRDKMGCKNDAIFTRFIKCNQEYLSEIGSQMGAHRVLVETNDAVGGSGGMIGIAGRGYPPETLLHELLHTYGLADEYEYEGKDAEVYCSTGGFNFLNVVSFSPRSSYSSDVEARSIHQSQIPWYSEIKSTTLITSGLKLGTTSIPGSSSSRNEAGLFSGGGCIKKVPTWKPYADDNVMSKSRATNIPPYHAKVIVRAMSAERGEKITLLPAQPTPPAEEDARVNQNQSKSSHSTPAQSSEALAIEAIQAR